MSKRFMDTDLWDQSWYVELSAESKNIWAYLERMCDCAGILKIEIPEMKRKIGCTEISMSKFLKEVNRDFDGDTGKTIERNRVMYIPNKSKIWMKRKIILAESFSLPAGNHLPQAHKYMYRLRV